VTASQARVAFDPFGNDNAKYLNPADVARTFVPIGAFWKLFNDKNHVVLGTRGSGKTAIAKMISHNHLKLLDHPTARQYISEKRFIGVYAPARLNWVSGVKSQLLGAEGPVRDYFILRINFILAQSLLATLTSCVESYVDDSDRAHTEYRLVNDILEIWAPQAESDRPIYTLKDLAKTISRTDFRLQRVTTRNRYGASPMGLNTFDASLTDSFGTELAQPVTALWPVIQEAFSFSDSTRIVVAIDEMEFLTQDHHRILNGLLRTYEGAFLFKFITAPYCHYTLATETNAPLIEDHDFSYIHMDNDRQVDLEALPYKFDAVDLRYAFHIALFLRRAEAAGIPADPKLLHRLLGPSEVLDPASVTNSNVGDLIRRMARHTNDKTQDRLLRFLGELHRTPQGAARTDIRRRASNELIRKLKPIVRIRELIRERVGARKGTAYSGMSMVLSCTDGNPRILIRTFKGMFPDLRQLVNDTGAVKMIPVERQNEVLETISDRFLSSIWAVPDVGPDLSRLITRLGEEFQRRLHVESVSTDVFASIDVSETDHDIMPLIKQAVAWGFMYPHFKDEKRPALPVTEGEFRLAYTLAPKFSILPRRGRSLQLKNIIPQLRMI
jgi:hypothetical protein